MTTTTTKIAEALHEVYNLILLKGNLLFLQNNITENVSSVHIRRSGVVLLSFWCSFLLSSKERPCNLFKVPAAAILNGMQCTMFC